MQELIQKGHLEIALNIVCTSEDYVCNKDFAEDKASISRLKEEMEEGDFSMSDIKTSYIDENAGPDGGGSYVLLEFDFTEKCMVYPDADGGDIDGYYYVEDMCDNIEAVIRQMNKAYEHVEVEVLKSECDSFSDLIGRAG